MARANSQTRLMAAFGFDADELEANRQGYMTKSQRQKLYSTRWNHVWKYGAAAVLWLVLCVGVLVDAMQRGNISLVGAVVGAFVLAGIPAMLIFRVEDWRRRINIDLYEDDFETVSGNVEVLPVVTKGHRQGYYTTLPKLRIGTKEFETPVLPDNIFVDGDNYRVFYVPKSMSILTIEHLGGSQEASKHNKAQHKHS